MVLTSWLWHFSFYCCIALKTLLLLLIQLSSSSAPRRRQGRCFGLPDKCEASCGKSRSALGKPKHELWTKNVWGKARQEANGGPPGSVERKWWQVSRRLILTDLLSSGHIIGRLRMGMRWPCDCVFIILLSALLSTRTGGPSLRCPPYFVRLPH